jgi:thiamine pyrophosphate-dependent acetolactate synthase large subunit-like protein
VRQGVPLIVVVCNDGSYGAEYVQFRKRGVDPGQSLFRWPEFAELAHAHGVHAVTVQSADDLPALAEALRAPAAPLLIDIKIDPETIPVAVSVGH